MDKYGDLCFFVGPTQRRVGNEQLTRHSCKVELERIVSPIDRMDYKSVISEVVFGEKQTVSEFV